MKILYGITKSNFGGAQRYVYELADEAKNKGFDVSVLCGRAENDKTSDNLLIKKLGVQNIKVTPIDGLQRDISFTKEISSFFQILKIIKNERPDVFHINSSKMGALGAMAGRLAGIKNIIFTAHGWAFNEPRPLWQKIPIKFFAWLTILCTHKTISVSEKIKKDMERWPFTKNKLVVIHNGMSRFNLAQRENGSFTVGTIAELHRIKGLDILLIAWNKFIKKHQAKLVIIGEGEERKNLENMAQKLGISDSVIFKGSVDNARSFLSNFDIFCMPSRSEGMPYALLEAGLAKLPVIASAVGGITEIIENGQNGILVEPEDAETIFSSLILLTEDKDLRERLGTNLKASIEEEFSFENMVLETFKLYN
ncbi:MAG: hypothetical protein COX06_01265 [Candidatus Zambryskibacteria bacterium CG22_combo_CG10-13_8_21_14_all_42_17]|uniref:Glycosyl transferase family 1 n=1 Tax=Candidatus Zambryskibacteria bacterium CG22_combo_CG10-13_8_21_14_all_42_17 TaxID=1975118 RepID=A0A2H0BDR1_9BACT|nr:MAG: hypothetical protein COX06_01265 [Candidatus Zambryskibacteria bacterium CG22_combo_CG10-13_8_21_14_all_42_17]